MPSFQHILFPVDFSQQNGGIAPYVAYIARRYRARVTMLHVLEIPSAGYPGWPAHAALIDFQAMIDDRRQRTESFLKTEFQEIATTRVMDEGDPARQIVAYAEKEKVDLIMMPTHGYGPFRRFLLGSVTAKLLHDVKCPVWTSAHAPNIPAQPAGYRNVLCAVDLTPNSVPLVQWASGFVREHGARLKLVHAIPSAEPQSTFDIEGGRFRAFLSDVAREELAKVQKQAGTDLDAVLRAGDVAQVVREAAEVEDADLVVIGRGVMHELFGRMRTHVYSVIREAPCPVISV
jgi:nucleotide-binding universal stress UspA family protein